MTSGTDTNVVFFGTEDFSLAALSALVDAGYTVAAVVTKPDSPRGRGMQVREPVVKTYAREHGITVSQPQKLGDITDDIAAIPHRVGVLSAYGKIVPQSILDLFATGITNIHPSLLPHYRGPSPIETAIMNGDDQTGVSLMRLVAAMDAGPLYAQKTFMLDDAESAPNLYKTLAQVGAELLLECLPSIMDGALNAHEQTDDATYTKLLQKTDALVNQSVRSATWIDRHVRAYAAYPRTRIMFGEVPAIVTAAHVVNHDARGLVIPCADETFLAIDTVIAPSGRQMTGAAFINGYLKT